MALQGAIVAFGALALMYIIDQHGLGLTMVIVAAVYCENAGAQIFGKKYGRTPLSPRYSPNKTLEGAMWGWVCGSVCGLLFLALAVWQNAVESPMIWVVVAAIAPPLAELGDLIESRMKRLVGVDDSGDLTRGSTRFVRIASLSGLFGKQGGALDKTDSLWLVACASAPLLVILA
ncbi:MAG TPA: phosphatidate cytidylyltransferase [Candidatus Saccharibacteria bacterium]|nr:phosphatidate cytidylyltransferase [Candidatus Saccharibacteria bacterium]